MAESLVLQAALLLAQFFDQSIHRISRYDVCDFICWSMFDGRNQEHLTTQELHELECFVEDLEYRLSLKLHGQKTDEDANEFPNDDANTCPPATLDNPVTTFTPTGTLQRDVIVKPMATFTPTKDDVSNLDEETTSSASDASGTSGRPRPKKRMLIVNADLTLLLIHP